MRKFKEYDKYKNTDIAWLNKIPSHWTEFPNRYFFTELKNKVGKNSSKYTLLSLTKNGVIIRDLSEMKGKFPAEFDFFDGEPQRQRGRAHLQAVDVLLRRLRGRSVCEFRRRIQ